MMNVTIKIKYMGRYAKKTGVRIEELKVNENIEEAYQYLVKYFKEKYDFDPPYILMVNNMHIIGAIKNNIPLKNGDVFKLLSFISGG